MAVKTITQQKEIIFNPSKDGGKKVSKILKREGIGRPTTMDFSGKSFPLASISRDLFSSPHNAQKGLIDLYIGTSAIVGVQSFRGYGNYSKVELAMHTFPFLVADGAPYQIKVKYEGKPFAEINAYHSQTNDKLFGEIEVIVKGKSKSCYNYRQLYGALETLFTKLATWQNLIIKYDGPAKLEG